jgi:Holliday junction resolvasome RuvABC endonuclease subunit
MYAFAQDAIEVAGAFRQFSSLIDARGVQALLVELPHGSQSAAAAKSAGYAVGIMGCLSACHDLPMDFVTPQRVKKLASGSASATKRQMIDRACELAPIKVEPRGRLSVYSIQYVHIV